jgi:hypothetical protein
MDTSSSRAMMELLLCMNGCANGCKFKSCKDETAINLVNAKTESDPFSTD